MLLITPPKITEAFSQTDSPTPHDRDLRLVSNPDIYQAKIKLAAEVLGIVVSRPSAKTGNPLA